jgi:hypothetical protein
MMDEIGRLHPNNNRGTETQQSTSDFDANGNLLTLNNIGSFNPINHKFNIPFIYLYCIKSKPIYQKSKF